MGVAKGLFFKEEAVLVGVESMNNVGFLAEKSRDSQDFLTDRIVQSILQSLPDSLRFFY